MKQRDLVKKLNQNGWYLLKHGGEHDIYTNGIKKVQVPRHKEIKEILAQSILKQAELK